MKGDLLQFGMQYHKCSLAAFLEMLDLFSLSLQSHKKLPAVEISCDAPEIKINSVEEITNKGLIEFLMGKNIDLELAKKYLCHMM